MNIKNTICIGLLVFAGPAQPREFIYGTPANTVAKICAAITFEAHKRAGLKVKYEDTPSTRTLISANAGILDGVVCRIKDIVTKYQNLIRVDPPVFTLNGYVYTKNISFEVNNWSSIKYYSIGIKRGHLYAENGTRGMNVTPVTLNTQLVRMLGSGRIDVAIMIDVDALVAMKVLSNKIKIKKLTPAISSLPIYFHFHRKNASLIPKLSDVLIQMKQEGVFKKLSDQVVSKEHMSKK